MILVIHIWISVWIFQTKYVEVSFLTKPVLLWLLDPRGPDADHPDEQNQQDDEDNSASDS